MIAYFTSKIKKKQPGHSKALRAAIISRLAALYASLVVVASGVSTLSQPYVITSTLPLLHNI